MFKKKLLHLLLTGSVASFRSFVSEMRMSELIIKLQLSENLEQQLAVFKQVRQAQSVDEAIETIIQEYFRLMSPQITQDLIPFETVWIANVLFQQGTFLAQLQQITHDLKHLTYPLETSISSNAPANNLDITNRISVSHQNWSALEIDSTMLKQGITGTTLAQRLGVNSSAISRKRNQSEFKQWTQVRDPHKVAWEYRVSTCRFHPAESL